jgi:nitrogen fixation-related uncharacterized protein
MKAFVMHHQILALWLGLFLVNASVIGAVVWWAVRKGQFRDQDHARYLALEASLPSGKPSAAPAAPATDTKEDQCSS